MLSQYRCISGAGGGQKKALGPLDLGFYMVVTHTMSAENEPEFSAREVCSLHFKAIDPALAQIH